MTSCWHEVPTYGYGKRSVVKSQCSLCNYSISEIDNNCNLHFRAAGIVTE